MALKQLVLLLLAIGVGRREATAQPVFSIATDISILRNLSQRQHFTAIGQTVAGNMHFSEKESAYAWVSYYTNGRFNNKAVAIANGLTTQPNALPYTVNTTLRYRQVSLGWKHYFRGSYNAEMTWSLYGLAGFGLLLAKATNSYSQTIDTIKYEAPLRIAAGEGKFKRLTFDLGLGTEIPLGSTIYFYTELRSWLPASDYPSPYLLRNSKLPQTVLLCGGIRILID